jgi:hypothetical protein
MRKPLSVGGKELDIFTIREALAGPWPAIGAFEDQKVVDNAVDDLVTLGLISFDDNARLFPVRFAKAPTDREIVANIAKAAEAGRQSDLCPATRSCPS